MRKLKLQVQMTIDGFMAGPNGGMDWLCLDWSDDIKEYVTELTKNVDTILLGKNLAQGFIPHWTASLNSDQPEEGAETFVMTPKVVFSKTLKVSEWERTTMANGDLKTEVMALKNKTGKDMIVYGGSQFVSSLIKEKLIDELHLFINPAVIGKGLPIFHAVTEQQNFELVKATSFECGIVVLRYKLK